MFGPAAGTGHVAYSSRVNPGQLRVSAPLSHGVRECRTLWDDKIQDQTAFFSALSPMLGVKNNSS